MRQMGKQRLTLIAIGMLVLAGLLGAAAIAQESAPPASEDPVPHGARYVVNPLTGVALGGMDPVSYFTDPEPQQGVRDFEFVWAGVPWYFSTAANRAVFMGAPEVYAPQFGGHGLTALARGFLSDGNPRIYVIHAQRLFLFYSRGNREAFELSRRQTLEDAQANWDELLANPPVE